MPLAMRSKNLQSQFNQWQRERHIKQKNNIHSNLPFYYQSQKQKQQQYQQKEKNEEEQLMEKVINQKKGNQMEQLWGFQERSQQHRENNKILFSNKVHLKKIKNKKIFDNRDEKEGEEEEEEEFILTQSRNQSLGRHPNRLITEIKNDDMLKRDLSAPPNLSLIQRQYHLHRGDNYTKYSPREQQQQMYQGRYLNQIGQKQLIVNNGSFINSNQQNLEKHHTHQNQQNSRKKHHQYKELRHSHKRPAYTAPPDLPPVPSEYQHYPHYYQPPPPPPPPYSPYNYPNSHHHHHHHNISPHQYSYHNPHSAPAPTTSFTPPHYPNAYHLSYPTHPSPPTPPPPPSQSQYYYQPYYYPIKNSQYQTKKKHQNYSNQKSVQLSTNQNIGHQNDKKYKYEQEQNLNFHKSTPTHMICGDNKQYSSSNYQDPIEYNKNPTKRKKTQPHPYYHFHTSSSYRPTHSKQRIKENYNNRVFQIHRPRIDNHYITLSDSSRGSKEQKAKEQKKKKNIKIKKDISYKQIKQRNKIFKNQEVVFPPHYELDANYFDESNMVMKALKKVIPEHESNKQEQLNEQKIEQIKQQLKEPIKSNEVLTPEIKKKRGGRKKKCRDEENNNNDDDDDEDRESTISQQNKKQLFNHSLLKRYMSESLWDIKAQPFLSSPQFNKRILKKKIKNQSNLNNYSPQDDQTYLNFLGIKQTLNQPIKKIRSIPNKFNSKIRDNCEEKFIDFNKLDESKIHVLNSTNKHFIRRKQNQFNIKRCCGVSYVVKSQSQQIDVADRYDKLSHIVYQATDCVDNLKQPQQVSIIDNLIHRLFLSQTTPIVVTSFQSNNQLEMKTYLLMPQKRWQIARQKCWIIYNIKDLWHFIKEKCFLCLHLVTDANAIVKAPNIEEFTSKEARSIIEGSDLQLGILSKCQGKISVRSLIQQYGYDYSQYFSSNKRSSATTSSTQLKKIDETKDDEQDIGNPDQDDELVELEGEFLPQSQQHSQQPPTKQLDKSPQQIRNKLSQLTGAQWDKQWSQKDGRGILLRIQLFIEQNKWKKCTTAKTKSFLLSFIQNTHDMICHTFKQMNQKRKICQSLGKQDYFQNQSQYAENGKVFRIGSQCNSNYSKSVKYSLRRPNSLQNKEHPIHFDANLYTFPKLQAMNEIETKIESGKINGKLIPEMDPTGAIQILRKRDHPPVPLFASLSRDCFVYDVRKEVTILDFRNGRNRVKKTKYFFTPDSCPQYFIDEYKKNNKDLFTGMTTYQNFFTSKQLFEIEANAVETQKIADKLLPMTAQTSNPLKRTKFFFGNRYIWSQEQLAQKLSYVAAGVRSDVSEPMPWMRKKVVDPLEESGIVEKNFIDSIALNVYQDGTQGLGQHFDDSTRFKQPIYTLRLFSDSRLAFGCQLYGFVNGAFYVPLSRGCICVMEDGGFGANGVKHCIRPCDMTGKSAAFILRKFQEAVVIEAKRYDTEVDLPMWFSSLSLRQDAVKYCEQKRSQAKGLVKSRCSMKRNNDNNKKKNN